MPLKIILAATDDTLANAWRESCDDLDFVCFHRGSILELNCDAVVSPANSFGFMDGGIDAAYSQRFGWAVQDRIQQLIRERHAGELLVGMAEMVDTDDLRIPFLITAPTMRVPTVLSNTVNPFLATRAVLRLVLEGTFHSGMLKGERIQDAIKTVAFPGMGTGVGRVAPSICARQVRAAIDQVILGRQAFPSSWADAQIRHQRLFSDRLSDLQIMP